MKIERISRAISGGWVGSSAVSETGQHWMSAARTAVRLGTEGWMSEMVGKSKLNFTISSTWSGTQAGYDAGYRGSLVMNATGQNISTICGYDRVNFNGVRDAIVVSNANGGYSGCRISFQGFKNNEVLTLPNSGVNSNNGFRLYALNWSGPDLYWWLREGIGWDGQVTGVIEFY